MKNLEMFCLAIQDEALRKIDLLNYIPVALGEKKICNKLFKR